MINSSGAGSKCCRNCSRRGQWRSGLAILAQKARVQLDRLWSRAGPRRRRSGRHLDKARTRCVCGCYVKVGSILEQALRETQQGPLPGCGHHWRHFHGELDAAIAIARQLRAAGTRLFLFQQGNSDLTERAFRLLAETTGGAYFHSILTSSASRNGCRDCLRRSPISRSAACLLWKHATTRRQSVARADEYLKPNCKLTNAETIARG